MASAPQGTVFCSSCNSSLDGTKHGPPIWTSFWILIGTSSKIKEKKCKYLVNRMGSLGVDHENFVLSKMDIFISHVHFICFVLCLRQLPLTKTIRVIHTLQDYLILSNYIGWPYRFIQCISNHSKLFSTFFQYPNNYYSVV